MTPAGFARWFPDFIGQCECRKSDEYEATKGLSEGQYESWREQREMHLRNRNYPLLRSL